MPDWLTLPNLAAETKNRPYRLLGALVKAFFERTRLHRLDRA